MVHTLSVDIIYVANQLSDSEKGSKLSFTTEDSWGKQTAKKKKEKNKLMIPAFNPSFLVKYGVTSTSAQTEGNKARDGSMTFIDRTD